MKDSGFTIVELLLVVAIIAILATLALSNFALFKSTALNATAASDARGLAPGVDMVSTEAPPPTIAPFTGNGGAVAGIPGGKTSPGTFGTIEFQAPNEYRIKTYQIGGDCFTLENGVFTVTSGVCT